MKQGGFIPHPSPPQLTTYKLLKASWMNQQLDSPTLGNWDITVCSVLQRHGSPPASPESPIQPKGFSLHRMGQTAFSGKERGGVVCFLINSTRCMDVAVLESSWTRNILWCSVVPPSYRGNPLWLSHSLHQFTSQPTPMLGLDLRIFIPLLVIPLKQNTLRLCS